MDIADVLLDYYHNDFCKESPNTLCGMTKVDSNVVVVKIMHWLRLEYKRQQWKNEGKKTFPKPMKINMKFPWCQDLKKVLEEEEMFGYYFVIKENQFNFSTEISEQEKEIIRKKIFEGFNPIMVIN